jgi:multidrug efflux pump subunit AcrA (membrane-fusion protein)
MTNQTIKQMAWMLCTAVALTACNEKIEVVEVIRSIKTQPVNRQATEELARFAGLVAAVDSSGLSFQVGGQVISVNVDVGDRVTKSQVLATLDPEPYQMDVDAAEAELIQTQDNVISIHLVLSDRTRALVSKHELALMKPSAVLVNTSRGPIADEAALIEAPRSATRKPSKTSKPGSTEIRSGY